MRKNPKLLAQQADVRQHLHDDIGQRAQPSADHDDPQPVAIRTAADEMHQRDHHQDDPETIVAVEAHVGVNIA